MWVESEESARAPGSEFSILLLVCMAAWLPGVHRVSSPPGVTPALCRVPRMCD